jgi:hypothetical protein
MFLQIDPPRAQAGDDQQPAADKEKKGGEGEGPTDFCEK